MWGVVKDAALRHRKFEKRSDEVPCPPPAPKRPRTGFFDALHEFIEERPPISSIADTGSTHELDLAIESYRKLPVLPQDADPLGFWRDNSASLLLRPLLPLAASVSAVPATEAICELLFKAGGQVLTSARLRLLGSRVEGVLMTYFNLQLANDARQRPD